MPALYNKIANHQYPMPNFRYQVINPENKELSGIINAPDEKSARLELNQLGFSIITIEDVGTETLEAGLQPAPAIPLFEFAALDKNQKRVAGTIQSENLYSAYKRLVKEYVFEVEYLFDAGIKEEQKIAEKQKGVFEMQNRLDMEEFAEKKKKMGSELDIQAFERQQTVLAEQVGFVLKKVKEILDLYETEIKPETKEKIRRYVDKILRIKNSTNLDYIRNTCEELLTFIQKEELFLHEDLRRKEHTKLLLEAKGMMMQLHRSKLTPLPNIKELFMNWRQEHILDNEQPNTFERFLNFLIGILIGFTQESAEILEIHRRVRVLNQQLWQYIILYFQDVSPEFKNEAKSGFKNLLHERKKLVHQLKTVRQQNKRSSESATKSDRWENLKQELHDVSGWLLAFYLCYYFASLYLNNKKMGIGPLSANFDILRSSFLKYFFAILFLFHVSLAVKINFFRRSEIATFIVTPLFLLGSILILLNF